MRENDGFVNIPKSVTAPTKVAVSPGGDTVEIGGLFNTGKIPECVRNREWRCYFASDFDCDAPGFAGKAIRETCNAKSREGVDFALAGRKRRSMCHLVDVPRLFVAEDFYHGAVLGKFVDEFVEVAHFLQERILDVFDSPSANHAPNERQCSVWFFAAMFQTLDACFWKNVSRCNPQTPTCAS